MRLDFTAGLFHLLFNFLMNTIAQRHFVAGLALAERIAAALGGDEAKGQIGSRRVAAVAVGLVAGEAARTDPHLCSSLEVDARGRQLGRHGDERGRTPIKLKANARTREGWTKRGE